MSAAGPAHTASVIAAVSAARRTARTRGEAREEDAGNGQQRQRPARQGGETPEEAHRRPPAEAIPLMRGVGADKSVEAPRAERGGQRLAQEFSLEEDLRRIECGGQSGADASHAHQSEAGADGEHGQRGRHPEAGVEDAPRPGAGAKQGVETAQGPGEEGRAKIWRSRGQVPAGNRAREGVVVGGVEDGCREEWAPGEEREVGDADEDRHRKNEPRLSKGDAGLRCGGRHDGRAVRRRRGSR